MKGHITATSSSSRLNGTGLFKDVSYPEQARIVEFLLLVYYIAQYQKLGDRCLGDILRQDQPYPGRGASLVIREQMGRSLVAGFNEHEYSAHSREHPPLDHSASWPPDRSREPFLLEVGVGRPNP